MSYLDLLAVSTFWCLFDTYLHNNLKNYFKCKKLFFRLVGDEERRWTDENIDMVALKHFPNIDKEKALNRPILYSNWLSKVK